MNELRKNDPVILKYEDADKQVGIEIDKGNVVITLPKVFNVNTTNIKQRNNSIKLLINVLEKYKQKVKQTNIIEHQDNLVDNFGDKFQFNTCIKIIQDFLLKGYYIETEAYYAKAKAGNINFKRTIKQKQGYISNNQLVYLDFIVRKNKITTDNPIHLIHKYIVEQCVYYVGWFFPSFQYERNVKLPFSYKTAIQIINKEIQKTFLDHKKVLLKRLKDFLIGAEKISENSGKLFLKVKKYEHVWEEMLRVVLGNEENKSFNSKSSWWTEDHTLIKNNSESMPDIIYTGQKYTLVLDAKHYSYSVDGVKSMPGTVDINKQIAYSLAIKHTRRREYVLDAFLLPHNNKEVFSYFGYATSEFMKNKKVHGIFVDVNSVMNRYVSNKEAKDFQNELYRMLVEYEEK